MKLNQRVQNFPNKLTSYYSAVLILSQHNLFQNPVQDLSYHFENMIYSVVVLLVCLVAAGASIEGNGGAAPTGTTSHTSRRQNPLRHSTIHADIGTWGSSNQDIDVSFVKAKDNKHGSFMDDAKARLNSEADKAKAGMKAQADATSKYAGENKARLEKEARARLSAESDKAKAAMEAQAKVMSKSAAEAKAKFEKEAKAKLNEESERAKEAMKKQADAMAKSAGETKARLEKEAKERLQAETAKARAKAEAKAKETQKALEKRASDSKKRLEEEASKRFKSWAPDFGNK